MIAIYEKDATDFTSNGLGLLNPTSCVVTEIMNGNFEVTMFHSLDEEGKFSRIQEERIIKVPVPAGKTPRITMGAGAETVQIYKVETVSGKRLYLRAAPSQSAKGIHAYKPGTEVVVIDNTTNSQWSEVTTPDGRHGWMWTGNLEYVRTETNGTNAEEGIKEPTALREQPFRIYKVEPTLNGVTVYARHIFYDLMDNMVGEYKPSKTTKGAAAFIGLAAATEDDHGFTFYSDVESTAEGVEIIDKNPVEAILGDGGLIANYGGELRRDWWDVYLADRIGEETGIQIREGKNLLGVKYGVDLTNVKTRIIPKGEDKDGNPLYLPERYMENEAEDKAVYVNHKYSILEVKEAKEKTKGDDKRTKEECYDLMREAVRAAYRDGADRPDVALNVDFVDCAETEEYKQYQFLQGIHMGDTVQVIAKRVGIKVSMRLMQYSFNCLSKRYERMALGTTEATLSGLGSMYSWGADKLKQAIRNASASGVDTGENGVRAKITEEVFEVDIPGQDGDFRLDESGARVPVLVSDSVAAPNIAPRYDGPAKMYVDPAATNEQLENGGYYRSLRDALSTLSGRWIDMDVTIDLAGGMTEYGELKISGVTGGGSLSIYGVSDDMPRIVGGLELYALPFQVNLYGLNIEAIKNGIYAIGCPVVDIAMCKVTGPGVNSAGTRCVIAGRGSTVTIRAAELYDCERSLYGENGGVIAAYACSGNCRVGVKRSTIYVDGEMPCDSAEWATDIYNGQIIERNVVVNQGTPPGGGAQQQPETATFDYTESDNYRGGWSYFADNDIRQGWNGKPIYGVIWFNTTEIRNELSGKTIKQASLRLQMQIGVGRGVAVEVQLNGSDVSADKTTAPSMTTSYGVIGKTNPGAINEITIPTQAVIDIVNGTIGALVLKSADETYYNDRKYSKNYARFSGSTSAGTDEHICPRLTVIYQ